MKIVLDTNVIIKGGFITDRLDQKGKPIFDPKCKRILDDAVERKILIVSEPAIRELRVTAIEKLQFPVDQVEALIARISPPNSTMIPMNRKKIPKMGCYDRTDDLFLAMAVKAKADYLVSKDSEVTEMGSIGTLRIVTPTAYILRELEANSTKDRGR